VVGAERGRTPRPPTMHLIWRIAKRSSFPSVSLYGGEDLGRGQALAPKRPSIVASQLPNPQS
jgi:hypothetical protein